MTIRSIRLFALATLCALTAATVSAQASAQGQPSPGPAAPASPAVQPAAPTSDRATASPPQPGSDVQAATEKVVLTAGRSTVLSTDFAITRIAVTNPAVADATVVQPREILIDGKSAGTVSLIVWGATERRQYDLVVNPGVVPLEQKLQSLFPGEDIHVSVNDEAIILSGRVSSNLVSLRAAEIAAATSSKAKVVNLLQLPGGNETQQVLLQVRFAEVSRTALTELGVSLFTGPSGYKDWVGRGTTQQFSAPGYSGRIGPPPASNPTDEGKLTFSDFLNLFLFNTKYDVGALVRALQNKGLFQSLAEPNLIAYNGQPASFLAGGEIPIPIVQGGVGFNSVTVQYKEFGIRLNFTPTIAGDTIRLKVAPEVSSLDYNNAIQLSGFTIPALSVRRAETDVELRDGQSFAIAGLLDNETRDNASQIPALGKLPIIGNLFKSKSTSLARTELMVLITPRLVRPLNPDEVPALPTLPKKFLKPEEGVGEQLEGGGGVVDAPPAPTERGNNPQKPVEPKSQQKQDIREKV